MGEPTAPVLPADTPQDVKDFFDCKGDKLVWKKGKVTWLGLPVDPDVSFEHGKAKGSIDITIDFPLIPKFTLNASVNDAGELVVDTSKIPDLSALKEGAGPKGIDDAIKNINDWFKKNGKKLKGATLKKGEVTLEKVAISTAYAPPIEVPATAVPVSYTPMPMPSDAEWDGAVAQTTVQPAPRSMWPSFLVLTIFVAILGLITGVLVLGGKGTGGVANASPTAPPTAPPTANLSASPTASPPASPTAGATATPSATSSLDAYIISLCVRVNHEAYNQYVSYLAWAMYFSGFAVDHFELTIIGANDDSPVTLVLDKATGNWTGRLGLHQPGAKPISSLTAVLADGTQVDVTPELLDYLGYNTLQVRYPQEDTFGDCPSPTP